MSYRILCKGHQVNNDTWVTGLNNNDCIIGPSGAGKTRGYVLPNLLQCNESIIVTTSKDQLREKTEQALLQNGYKVLELNFQDCGSSPYGYNPLNYIRYDSNRGCYNEQDILQLAAILSPVTMKEESFWEKSAQMALSTMISYVLEYLPENEHHLGSVVKLLREMSTGNYDKLLDEVCTFAPDSFAAIQYQMLRNVQKSSKTYGSIQAFIAEKLFPFAFHGAQHLFKHTKQIQFTELGKQKTVLFLKISDNDSSMDTLITMLYTQALQVLCQYADACPAGRLLVPVRLIMDDFTATGAAGCIKDFDKITSVIRSREISVSIILQSLSQLEAVYEHHKAVTILNNCDHLLYLGGHDLETARYISHKANKSVHSILTMPLSDAWLFTRGSNGERVEKYCIDHHPMYYVEHTQKEQFENEYTEDYALS